MRHVSSDQKGCIVARFSSQPPTCAIAPVWRSSSARFSCDSRSRMRSVMSRAIPRKPVIAPRPSRSAVTVSSTGTRLPSFRTYVHSHSSDSAVRAFTTSASKPGAIARPSSALSFTARASTSAARWINSGVFRPTTSGAV